MVDVTLSAAQRNTVLQLQNTVNLINRTNDRLSTGLKVASPIDDARVFFEAQALSNRANDFSERRDSIDQGVSAVSGALEATEAIEALVRQADGIVTSARSATGSELSSLETQFNEVLAQIDDLTADTTFQGLNLINGTGESLDVQFSNLTTSVLNIASVDLTTASTGLNISSGANFTVSSTLDSTLDALALQIDNALTSLSAEAQTLGSNVGILQTRLDFTDKQVNVLQGAADKLTLADTTEEGANLVALQTRQQLGISALAFAGQAEQSVLSLFR
ncbi:MAG: flagellin [Kiloniellales bacterium]|nr:flagellin [Kiloniellales bacterium]